MPSSSSEIGAHWSLPTNCCDHWMAVRTTSGWLPARQATVSFGNKSV
jgi:hypothetical protein